MVGMRNTDRQPQQQGRARGGGGAWCSCKPLKASLPPRAALIALLCVSSAHQRLCLLPSLSDLRGDELDGCQACGVRGGRRRVPGERGAAPRGEGLLREEAESGPLESCSPHPSAPPSLIPWRQQVESPIPNRDGCCLSSNP